MYQIDANLVVYRYKKTSDMRDIYLADVEDEIQLAHILKALVKSLHEYLN